MTAVWSSPVRYVECDQQGIVFNAHYLTWADEGCTSWFALRGTPYQALLARGLDMRLKNSSLEWFSSVRSGDLVEVHVDAVQVGRTSFTVPMQVRVGDRLCCAVRTTYVLVDESKRPTPVPDDLRERWAS